MDKKVEKKPARSNPPNEDTKSDDVVTAIARSPHYFDNDDTSGGDGVITRQPTTHSATSMSYNLKLYPYS